MNALRSLPRGAPIGARLLRDLGVSAALASYYTKEGVIERLGRGVYRLPEDALDELLAVRFLAESIPGLHLGGKTALGVFGIRHNISPRGRLILWGEKYAVLPEWFARRFPSRYVSHRLFDSALPPSCGLLQMPGRLDGPLVSSPERALLELLDEVGYLQSVEEARHLMEGLRNPNIDVLTQLLRHCLRVKVVRLCLGLSEELRLDWACDLRLAIGSRGKGRWCSRLPDHSTLILKP